MRMVHRIFRHAANVRAAAQVASGAGLTQALVFVVGIRKLPDAGAAIEEDAAHFPGRQAYKYVFAFPGQYLGAGARPAHQLAAATGSEFQVVDYRTGRYVAQRQGVAGANLGIGPGTDSVAY
ncbi:hypothetical protein GBAR_LOCUS7160 [Geodia barretti]|uniref:Uncharacterized protein n=1 Tax=Geodia barretti TaxID=519541 RepID=A0AA35RGD8_GEOBA|nr:hypothetical protein GBAR_LOCUS7160 [Geodia barretti]